MRIGTGKTAGRGPDLRLFFAFEVPVPIRKAIAKKRQPLIAAFPKSRWVRPESQHLTVAFLGETARERVDELLESVSGPLEGLGRAEFSLHGAGFFPSSRHPKNAWIGGESELGAEVASRVNAALRGRGFDTPDKSWKLHLTQARFSKPWPPEVIRAFAEWVEELGAMVFDLDEVVLFASSLGPGGARYDSLGKVSLS